MGPEIMTKAHSGKISKEFFVNSIVGAEISAHVIQKLSDSNPNLIN
jgi:hypothetical protein